MGHVDRCGKDPTAEYLSISLSMQHLWSVVAMKITTINPATEGIIETYETMSRETVMEIARQSEKAFRSWRDRTIRERSASMTALGAVLRRNVDEYARLITIEMGKPITQSRAEVEKCAWLCDVYAERAEEWLEEESVVADGKEHFVAFEPLGVILSIMPWNYPFWQALRFAVPAVVAGNTSILKHASNVPQCAFAIESAFKEAGFPENTFRTIVADHAAVEALIESDIMRGVSLTGSTAAGARIAETAGRNLKKVVLELGGSDPFIVLEDADIDIAARNAVTGRMLSTGQSCIASKRMIVVESVAAAFTQRFAELMRDVVVGDPMEEETEAGAIVSETALHELEDQLKRAVSMGATVVTGGKRLDRKGFFLEPTVLTDVTPDMPVASEEVFGPIAPVLTVKDEDEAIAVANSTEFGLGGSVWTKDLERGLRVARRIEAGTVFVNSIVKSDPRMPFGGIKRSGLGRELSKYGLREFVNVKGINIYEHE
jgi:succinate-semialdehyde dehydrogenase/glutarate-semialdehyde dehydrogenase